MPTIGCYHGVVSHRCPRGSQSNPSHCYYFWLSTTSRLCDPIAWGWRDGSMVKKSHHSCRAPNFHSQHPHSCSKPSLLLVLGDLTPPSGLLEHCTAEVHIAFTQAKHIQITDFFKKSIDEGKHYVSWLQDITRSCWNRASSFLSSFHGVEGTLEEKSHQGLTQMHTRRATVATYWARWSLRFNSCMIVVRTTAFWSEV